MNFLKFYYTLSFYLLKILPKNLEKPYSFYFNVVVIVMKRPRDYAYSRYFLFDSFKALDRELVNFMKEHVLELNSEQQDLLESLLNVTRAFKRFLQKTEANKFPMIMENFYTKDLQEYIQNIISKQRIFRFPQESIILTSEYYLELAKKYESEASEYLK